MSPTPAELEARVAGLSGDVPVALLPVRLEARFVDDELRVRIFPDQIHLDSHEPELTTYERTAGEAYWRARFATPDPDARPTSPWSVLCGSVEPSRAVWVVEALTPLNLGQADGVVSPEFPAMPGQDAEWSVAARAVALPRRWLVVGRRDGAEVLRAWTAEVADRLDVSPAPDLDGPGVDDDIELQDTARWMVDFDTAERSGMAVRIPAAEVAGGLADGVDQLLVLGVDWDLTPADAAGSIRRLLTHHAYTDGMSAITPGTPTNVTSAGRPGRAPTDALLVAALDPERRPSADAVAGTAGDLLYRALGLPLTTDDLLRAVPGADGRSQATEIRLADALWESTLGSFLSDVLRPVVPDSQNRQLRDHVREHLFPGGPFPAVRVSRQPYGVLPVVAAGFEPDPTEPVEAGLLDVLGKLRIFWERAIPSVPRLGRTADLDADLDGLLQTTPLTAAVRFRTVLGPLTVSSTEGLDRHAVAQQYISSMLGVHLGVPPPTPWNEFALHPGHQRLDRPLVAGPTPGRLAEVAALARTSGSFDRLKAREDEVATLLEAMALYAAERELHRADLATINGFRVASGQLDALPELGVLPWDEYVGIEAAGPVPAGSVRVATAAEASRVMIPGVTGSQTVRAFVTDRLAGGTADDLATLRRVLDELDGLSSRPPDELDRALRGLLDAYSHRLDAWYTSLATRRLAALRSTTPDGVHLGAYGWLDELRPATDAGVNHGFVHAPSLPQAATAAVLRSGHLAHHDAEHQALEIDLTADRVRTALTLLDGVEQGQPLAALLGYRFERAVRDLGVSLAQYILPIRRLAPLRPDGAAPAPPTTSDHVAARDVVDGVALLERWRTEGPALFDALQQLVKFPPPPAEVFVMPPQEQRNQLAVELDRLADSYDAVADLLLAETVHQNVLGNHERAAAALGALDRQGRPPRVEFVRTPRTGKSYTQRLLVLIGDDAYPPSWPSPVRDPRSQAEPRLNAWLARILGDPRRIRFTAAVAGQATPLVLRFEELGLSPLSAVLAGQAPGRDEPSELEERLRQAFLAARPASAAAAAVTLLDEPPPGDPRFVGLGAFRALAHWAHTLVTTHRPAAAGDLALPQDEVGDRFDEAELSTRAAAVADAYAAATTRLEAAVSDASPDTQQLTDALWAAADLGVDGSVPRTMTDDGPASVDALLAQAQSVATGMTTMSTRAADVEGGSNRLKALLGQAFPVLPRFTVADPEPLRKSLTARTTLCAGDDLAPGAWLRAMGLVREGVERFARVRGAAELLHSDVVPRDLAVLQLPHATGDRWLALPFDRVPAGQLAVVAHTSGTVDVGSPLSGLFVDAWTETIPGREETTGLAFHHDAPGARAPQTILLAVPPAVTDPTWSVATLLDTLTEAQQLARIRGVGPDRLEWLGTMLPAVVLPDPASPDAPAVPLKRLATMSTGEG